MKKLLAVVLALVMVLALAVPAIAADGLTVSTTKSGNDVTIIVKNGPSTVAEDVVAFAKNTTQTYVVGAYQVQVVYNGGGVKSAEIISTPVADDSNDTITTANSEQTIYLKGSGSDFTANWRNMFYLGGAEEAEDPSVWHIVFTGKDMSLITAMQLDFGENGIWEWTPDMGFSVNGGGNNPGWVVVAPAGWELDYVNSGKNNESGCYVVTGESGNINFNISGYHEGTPDDVPFYTYIYINKFIAAGDSHLAGEGFEFDVFPVDGPFVTPIGTMISDADGLAELYFDPGLEEGTYIVRERVPDGYAPVNDLVFTVDADGVATFEGDVNVIINISLGKLNITDDVVEEYMVEYHKPVYKEYSYGTLVSWGNTLSGAQLPVGITGDLFLNNGMTYLKINKAALAALGDEGATIGIAESNKSGGNSVDDKWNTPIEGSKSYNIKIVDGKLVVTSDLPGFGAAVYDAETDVKGPQDIKHNGVTEYEIKTDNNGDFWFFFHIGSARYNLGEVIGCVFDYSEGPNTREFTGQVDITIIVYKGSDIVFEGLLGLVEYLEAGDDYKVEIYVNSNLYKTVSDVVVEAGVTTDVDFGNVVVNVGSPVIDIICTFCQ